jgi:hypothetical protein
MEGDFMGVIAENKPADTAYRGRTETLALSDACAGL